MPRSLKKYIHKSFDLTTSMKAKTLRTKLNKILEIDPNARLELDYFIDYEQIITPTATILYKQERI